MKYALLSVLIFTAVGARAWERVERYIVLSDEDIKACADGDGCQVITNKSLASMLARIHKLEQFGSRT